MNGGYERIAAAAGKLAAELPHQTVEIVARLINSSADLLAAEARMADFPRPHYRKYAAWFLGECRRVKPSLTPQAVAVALLTAAQCEKTHRDQTVELVWTGPEATPNPMRRTKQAILQVFDSAQHRITLVSYAVYQIPNAREALVRAARHGVHLQVIIETLDRLEGQNEYSTIRALGDDGAGCAAVYFWPQQNHQQNQDGRVGILHVKCAVADGRWLFLSSANLTRYAFDINMELGILVTGGNLPSQVENNFDKLIAASALHRI
jgi:phosphatidylserine/phosphatidylglycerophosphate/cardiolipin synthase-like enzyme